MQIFQVIDGQDDGLVFPDWVSPSLMNYSAKIRGEIFLVDSDLPWWDQINMLAAFGKKELDLGGQFSAKWYADYLVAEESIDPEDRIYFQKCSTPEGVRLMEGEGLLLHARLTEGDVTRPPDWKSVEKILPGKEAECVLYAYALYRVDNALSSQMAGDMNGALGCLAIAGDVLIMASEATARKNSLLYERRQAAERMRDHARKRHAETYLLREEVIKHWLAHIDRSLSGDKAAAILSEIFPLSHRKLSEYVMAEKRILRASTT